MKLNELLEVIDYSFDYADDEFDCTFYADAVDNKYTRLIDVKRVDTNYVVCSFTKFIEENKEFVFEYIDNDAIDKKFATKLKKGLEDGKEWAFSEFFDGGWATSMLEEEKLEMLDFEKLDGFVVDLSTRKSTLMELKNVLNSEEDRKDIIENYSTEDIREFIMEYYINTYNDAYIFVKKLNVYQIVEQELTTVKY